MLSLVLEKESAPREIGGRNLFSIELAISAGAQLSGYALEWVNESIKRHVLDKELENTNSLSVHFWFDRPLVDPSMTTEIISSLEGKKRAIEARMDTYSELEFSPSSQPSEIEPLASGKRIERLVIQASGQRQIILESLAEFSYIQIRFALTDNGEKAKVTAVGVKERDEESEKITKWFDLDLIESGDVKVIFHKARVGPISAA